MDELERDGITNHLSVDQILRRERRQADHVNKQVDQKKQDICNHTRLGSPA